MQHDNFQTRHLGFQRTFQPGRLSLGLMMPMSPLDGGIPDMSDQIGLAKRADELGFAALWSRDVPLFDPEFGDAGQIYDPWVWMSHLSAATKDIALSTAGIVLPLRHPIHVAKASSSLDVLSGGRFMLGLASGDRASEYPAFGYDHEQRGAAFRDGVETIRNLTENRFPAFQIGSQTFDGNLDLLPKPTVGRMPIVAVGSGRQTVQWIAENADGWITYARDVDDQRKRIGIWHAALEQKAPGEFRPFAQSLFVDLTAQPDTTPSPIFLGYRLGRNRLIDHLSQLEQLGVNHVMVNLRHSERPAAEVLEELAEHVLPRFPAAYGRAPDAAVKSKAA